MIFALLQQLLFPKKCVLCGKLLKPSASDLCIPCEQTQPYAMSIKKKIPFLSGCTSVWYYEEDVRKSLLRYKFSGRRSYCIAYARRLAMKLLDIHEEYDMITWVPVSSRRRFARGYDQVELIARALCKQLGRKHTRCLRKVRHNPAQSGFADASHRRANVLGVYRVVNPRKIGGKRILLLDDIITTGATISECAKTLHSAGAAKVHGISIAVSREHK